MSAVAGSLKKKRLIFAFALVRPGPGCATTREGSSTADAGLTRAQAEKTKASLWRAHHDRIRNERADEMKAKSITIGDHKMRFDYKKYGNKPKDGWSLVISMHGGGGAPARVNESQWKNQVRLGDAYKPSDAIYVAPRAPTDTWNLWHQSHIDDFFDRLIENFVALEGGNPDKVYIMGYSAGGDGVYQLATRMSDRLAAAAMMAGHPNETSPIGLRNIGFALHVGEKDGGYKRNTVGAEWGKKLKALREKDPDGYAHQVTIHKGKGHWMDLQDRAAVKWMQEFTREPFPKKIVWLQDDRTHKRFYWLAVPEPKKGQHIEASVDGQVIRIQKAEGVGKLVVRLDDRMLDLDKPLKILGPGGAELFAGKLNRSKEVIEKTLAERGDRQLVFSAEVEVSL